MILVRCKTGGETVEVPDGQDPHAFLDAAGCTHHGEADGDGPAAARRPIVVLGSITLVAEG